MSALGATAAPAAGGDAAADGAGLPEEEDVRAETPPPDERRFEDDDGTVFVWDGGLRRFVEEVRRAPPDPKVSQKPLFSMRGELLHCSSQPRWRDFHFSLSTLLAEPLAGTATWAASCPSLLPCSAHASADASCGRKDTRDG